MFQRIGLAERRSQYIQPTQFLIVGSAGTASGILFGSFRWRPSAPSKITSTIWSFGILRGRRPSGQIFHEKCGGESVLDRPIQGPVWIAGALGGTIWWHFTKIHFWWEVDTKKSCTCLWRITAERFESAIHGSNSGNSFTMRSAR